MRWVKLCPFPRRHEFQILSISHLTNPGRQCHCKYMSSTLTLDTCDGCCGKKVTCKDMAGWIPWLQDKESQADDSAGDLGMEQMPLEQEGICPCQLWLLISKMQTTSISCPQAPSLSSIVIAMLKRRYNNTMSLTSPLQAKMLTLLIRTGWIFFPCCRY